MQPEKRALGKGLSSLIPMGARPENNKNFLECSLSDIVTNPNQPRKLFSKEALDELSASIEEKGVLQPLLVRPIGGGKYELIAGERRYRAALQLHLDKIPVVIREASEQDVLELALIENIQRQDLNPIEEAVAYKDLLSKFQYTQDELAKRLGRDRSVIANTLRLLKLPEEVRTHIITGKLSMGHARALVPLENRDLQIRIANDIIQNEIPVREVEQLIRKLKDENEETADVAPERPKKVFAAMNPQLSDTLEKNLKTKVQIKPKGEKGKIILHYHSTEDFNRLYELLTR